MPLAELRVTRRSIANSWRRLTQAEQDGYTLIWKSERAARYERRIDQETAFALVQAEATAPNPATHWGAGSLIHPICAPILNASKQAKEVPTRKECRNRIQYAIDTSPGGAPPLRVLRDRGIRSILGCNQEMVGICSLEPDTHPVDNIQLGMNRIVASLGSVIAKTGDVLLLFELCPEIENDPVKCLFAFLTFPWYSPVCQDVTVARVLRVGGIREAVVLNTAVTPFVFPVIVEVASESAELSGMKD
jgi:hypothetical protein